MKKSRAEKYELANLVNTNKRQRKDGCWNQKENYKGKKQSGLKNQVGTDFGPKKQYKNTLFCSSRCF